MASWRLASAGTTRKGVRQAHKIRASERTTTAKNSNCCCSTELTFPRFASIEETLKILAAALEALRPPGLDKAEVCVTRHNREVKVPGVLPSMFTIGKWKRN